MQDRFTDDSVSQAFAVGSAGFLHPSTVFPDKARVEKDEHFAQVQKLLLDPPVKMHRPKVSFLQKRSMILRKKIPGPIVSIRGFPFFILKITREPLTTKAVARL
jgi:hypothetical protein